jgi:hypothetical protein
LLVIRLCLYTTDIIYSLFTNSGRLVSARMIMRLSCLLPKKMDA